MAKKMNYQMLDELAGSVMDETIKTILDTPTEKDDQQTEQDNSIETLKDKRIPYNYRKEKMEIEGVGVVEKVISEKGNIIGRPNRPKKDKKRPISLTLPPDLYDLVKERAAADHRTTSEYLAIIIEEYLRK